METRLLLSDILAIQPNTLEDWLELSPSDLVQNPQYNQIFSSIDAQLLHQTRIAAQAAYDNHILALQQRLLEVHGIAHAPMFSNTMARWVLSIVETPEYIFQVLRLHQKIQQDVIWDTLPILMTALDDVPEGAREWQKAICILSLPMLVE